MKKKNMYWGAEEEKAIVEFLNAEEIAEKHVIYETKLEVPLKKLIENIYHTYNFHKILSNYYYDEHELLIFVYEKLDKFDPDRGTKAFSYFGTVIKNWLIQKSSKAKKDIHIDDENKESIMHDISIKKHSDENIKQDNKQFVGMLSQEIQSEKFYEDILTDEDKSVVEIISFILNNNEKFDIYNKKQLYVYVREATGLPARKITKALNKMKDAYKIIKDIHIEDE